MPSFICDNCQSSLKKNQLDSHKQRSSCSQSTISCVDCGKTFSNADYRSHISCLTEAEKYKHHLKISPKPMQSVSKSSSNSESKKDEPLPIVKDKSNSLYSVYKKKYKSKFSKKEFMKRIFNFSLDF